MADLSVTAANVIASANATLATGVIAAATTITQGQTVYVTALNTVGLADSDASSPANAPVGIALSAGSPGQKIIYVTKDPAFTPGATLTMATGAVYQSDTPGGITQTIGDLESGDTLVFLGIPLTTTTMNLNITTGGAI